MKKILIFLFIMLSIGLKAQVRGVNEKIINSLNVSNITNYYRYTVGDLSDFKTFKIPLL
jgi:hypothetical protein